MAKFSKPLQSDHADSFDYIEDFYNQAWRQSHLVGLSPEVFEQASSLGQNCLTERGHSICERGMVHNLINMESKSKKADIDFQR